MSTSPQSSRTVLVTGATGRHGRTGTTVVDALLAEGRDVRVLTRVDDDRAAALRNRGATTVIGDLHSRSSLIAAVDGVHAVYFTYPIATGVISAAANLASVLAEPAAPPLPHLVVMSMAVSSHGSPSRLAQAQAVAEEVFIWAGLNPTILRVAGLFHENVLILHGTSIRQSALITNSFGAGNAPWIAGRDAAELAVAELLKTRPAAAAISYPPAAEVLSHADIARIISEETGRDIRYQSITQQDWQAHLEVEATTAVVGSPINTAMAQHISIIGAGFAGGSAPLVTPDANALTAALGHPPTRFADFVREHRREFGAAVATSATTR